MTYEWENKETGEIREITCRMSEIDDFLKTVPDPDNWERLPQLAGVRTEKLSRTFLDGHITRSHKADLDDAKTAAKLESESFNMKPEERKGITKEINKLRRSKK